MVEVHFYSSESLAISRGFDGSVYSWDLSTGDMLKEFKQRGQGEAITCMDMCQETSYLALGNMRTVTHKNIRPFSVATHPVMSTLY